MMARDEDATLATLMDYRARMNAMIGRHRGRLVSTAGDGLLAEFASPVESVRCATEIQRELGQCNGGLPAEQQMRFRIGINLGDVMVDDDDLFGEGVNIAARLQTLAPPGGILIASTVFEQVKSKLAVQFDFLGEQHVKNITQGIPTYRVRIDPGAGDAGFDGQMAWSEIGASDEEEALASPVIDRGPPSGTPEDGPSADQQRRGSGLLNLVTDLTARLVGRSENEEARKLAQRSGVLGLVLAAIALVTPLDFMVWIGLFVAFVGAQAAIGKAGWGRRQSLRARLICLILLLLGINLVASFGEWWFIYPAVALGLIAYFIGDGPSRWGKHKPSS